TDLSPDGAGEGTSLLISSSTVDPQACRVVGPLTYILCNDAPLCQRGVNGLGTRHPRTVLEDSTLAELAKRWCLQVSICKLV
ncbi:hypothetical protein BaRGS_00020028, partial [Batillaria attramentaria]